MSVGFCLKSHIKMVLVLVGWLPRMQTCLDLQCNKRKKQWFNIGSAGQCLDDSFNTLFSLFLSNNVILMF